MATKAKGRVQINNKKASFEYEFLEQYDAGIVLVGTEITSLRAGKASLQDAYCYFSGGELYVRGMNIATYFWASAWSSHEPMRDRKLLLNSKEIRNLKQDSASPGYTIVPLRLFIDDNGRAKLDIALCKGKREFDKRTTMRERDDKRELDRVLKRF